MTGVDPEKLKLVKQWKRDDILFSMARIPQSKTMFVGSSDARIHALNLDAEKPELAVLKGHTSYVTGMALAGSVLVSGSYDGRLIWWDKDSHEIVRNITSPGRRIRGIVASPDEQTIASVGDDMTCQIWDVRAGRLLHVLRGHDAVTAHHYPSMLYACAFSADGQHLATADRQGKIVVWEVASGKLLASMEAPLMYTWDPRQRRHSIGGIRSLAFSPDGQLLAAGGIGKIDNIDHLSGKARVEVFDWRKNERTHEFPGDKFNGLVEHLAFHHQGQWLLAGGGDHNGFLMIYDLQQNKIVRQEKAPMHIHELALNESSDEILAVGHNRLTRWDFSG